MIEEPFDGDAAGLKSMSITHIYRHPLHARIPQNRYAAIPKSAPGESRRRTSAKLAHALHGPPRSRATPAAHPLR